MEQIRLDGWKAIASHLNRSVRQCQRLSESSGLPVHRFPGTKAVFAYTDELDRWLLGDVQQSSDPPVIEVRRSGRHVTLPVELVAGPVQENQGGLAPAADVVLRSAPPQRHRFILMLGVVLLAVVLLVLGIRHRRGTSWRNVGTPLTGVWTFKSSGVVGRSASVARFDTGRWAAPGTTATIALSSCGTRWSGGLEIFEDDLHWTFVAISPREHEIVVQRFPAGTVTTFFMTPCIEPARSVRLKIAVEDSRLLVGCAGHRLNELALDPWDVTRGRLVLRVGSPGDELHEPSGGTCTFKDLQLSGTPGAIPSNTVCLVAVAQRPKAKYILTASNIDDQIDVLIDGHHLASAGYREEIGPLTINPYLTRGDHTITTLLFNRKWTAAYAIRLTENGVVLWNESCGDVEKSHSGCQETLSRLGMVKRLSHTFTAR